MVLLKITKTWFIIMSLLLPTVVQSQDSTRNTITLSGYLETYYQFNPNRPSTNQAPGFIYSHNRSNEVNINIGLLKASYNDDRVRANLGLMTGTYANSNLAHEPGVLRNVFEANAGVRLSKSKSFWLDAGVLPSHIGSESAIGRDCMTLTRSILADNTPYYETGVRLSYKSKNEKWYFAGLLLNGWQRIQRPEGFTRQNYGTEITFTPSSRLTLNSSTFIGSDRPDSLNATRIFHDFFALYTVSKSFRVLAGFDISRDEIDGKKSTWYSPVVSGQFFLSPKLSTTVRAEYFSDRNGSATGIPNFEVIGISANVDLRIQDNMMFRAECKNFDGQSALFLRGEDAYATNALLLTAALAVSF